MWWVGAIAMTWWIGGFKTSVEEERTSIEGERRERNKCDENLL
jgi:hypothetical protein